MAPTASFFFGAAPEDTPAADVSAHAVVPDLSDAVARARLRRQEASGQGRQQAASRVGGGGGGPPPRKTPQRGLGVAELERLRCGGVDPLQDLSAAAAAAILEAAAANLQAQGNPVVLQHHHDYLPAFDAATGSHYYSPLLVQPPPAPPAPQPQPPAPVRFVQGVAPEQQYFMERWAAWGASSRRAMASSRSSRCRRQSALQAKAPSGVRRAPPPPASTRANAATSAPRYSVRPVHCKNSRAFCSSKIHFLVPINQSCLLSCAPVLIFSISPTKMIEGLADRGTRATAAGTTNAPYYSIYDLAATMTMTAASKETGGEGFLVAPEGRKEVREIEFFGSSQRGSPATAALPTSPSCAGRLRPSTPRRPAAWVAPWTCP
ncbi:hypothetical protein VPH35_010105 [Triticum aestivum]